MISSLLSLSKWIHAWLGNKDVLTLFRIGLFRAAYTYRAIMKLGTLLLYLRKILKICESRDTPLEFFYINIFSLEINRFWLYLEIKI